MKRISILLTMAASVAPALVHSQDPVISVDNSAAKAFYATEEWNKAFMGYFGVNSGVEPGVPEDQQAREVLAQVRDFLRSGEDQDFRAALNALENHINTQQAEEDKQPSPMMLQIAGTIAMRMAQTSDNDSTKRRYRQQAQRHLEQSLDPETGFPNFLRAHKNLANLYFRNDKSQDAKKHFIRAIELGDKDAVTYGLLGAIFMEEEKLVASENSLRNSLMINPDIKEFRQLLGNVLLQQERYKEAKEIFAELLMENPDNVQFWMAQSNCYIALDEIEKATRNLEIVRFMGEANVQSLMLLGDVYINKEMIEEATEVYLNAIDLDPAQNNLKRFIGAAETLNNFAAFDESLTVIDAIEEQFSESLSEEDEIELLSLRSEINISLGKGEEAAENLENLLRKDPMNARALLTLARYYSDFTPSEDLPSEQQDLERNRAQQQAIIYFERAQNLNDIDDQVRGYVGEAQLRVQRDELENAAQLLEEAQGLKYQESVQAYLDQIRSALKSRRS